MFVTSRDAEGAPDLMPAGWVMICNSNPPMMAVAVGFGRYTHHCLEETGEFVLAWPGVGQEQLIEQTGSTTGLSSEMLKAAHAAAAAALVELGSQRAGLSQEEAARRLEVHGPNAVAKDEGHSRYALLGKALLNPLVILLTWWRKEEPRDNAPPVLGPVRN